MDDLCIQMKTRVVEANGHDGDEDDDDGSGDKSEGDGDVDGIIIIFFSVRCLEGIRENFIFFSRSLVVAFIYLLFASSESAGAYSND